MKFDSHENDELKQRYLRRGMGIGMALFIPFGVILSLILGNPGLLGLGPAVGISIGIAIGEGMYKKHVLEE